MPGGRDSVALLAALTACAGGAREPPSARSAASAEPTPTVTLPPVAAADASADAGGSEAGPPAVCVHDAFIDLQGVQVSADGSELGMCFGDGSYPAKTECFVLTLATGVYRADAATTTAPAAAARAAPRRWHKPPPAPAFVPVKTKQGQVSEHVPSPDGSRLFVTRNLEVSGGPPEVMSVFETWTAEAYDARKGRKLSTTPLVDGGYKTLLNTITWLDDAHVYVRQTVAEFEDKSQAQVVDVAHGTTVQLGECEEEDELVHVADDVWVIQGSDGVVWMHARDGSKARTLDWGGVDLSTPRIVAGRRGDFLLVAKAVHTFATRGDVLAVDAASGKVLGHSTLAKCPAPP